MSKIRGQAPSVSADHIAVLDQALGQLPEAARARRILVRTDGAGFSHAFLDHLLALGLEYSVGYAVTDDVRDAIALLPRWAWQPAIDADGGLRDGAEVAELSEVLPEARRLAAARRRRERVKKAQANGQRYGPKQQRRPTGRTGCGSWRWWTRPTPRDRVVAPGPHSSFAGRQPHGAGPATFGTRGLVRDAPPLG